MSGKKEISSTLRNLKFMQRATPKLAKPKEEEDEEKPKAVDGGFGAPLARNKCKVITEGNPHPGAVKGRMSFQGFNPTIDKLNQETTESSKPPASPLVSERKNGESSSRSDFSTCGEDGSMLQLNATDAEHKRKKPEMGPESSSPLISRNSCAAGDGPFSSEQKQRNLQKQHKREKLDWNVLRREKAHAKQV